ncbi:hypothetical protein [Saccharophagus degradans]|uniref:hypothetical protein n=1 Tax=Saccharophagus degradans TaxID=86304 RepID=UPI00059D1C51|nr:hypothetical protein [Saccharophagus degradans]
MSKQLNEWFENKIRRPKGSLNSPVSVEGKMQRIYGPRADFAYVTLYLEPADEFSYIDEAEWPADQERCSPAVMEGVLDGLISSFQEYWYINVKVTLKEIKYHPVDSSPRSFYKASRNAIEKLAFEHKNEKSIFKSHI